MIRTAKPAMRRLAAGGVLALATACAHAIATSPSPLEHLSEAQRASAIRRAQVWTPTDVSQMDLRAGPQEPGAFKPFETVTCNYVERKFEGDSPKFACALSPDDEVKVKYGETNGEVFAEVAATRLLWALGFGADRMYPVVVVCRGCPSDPHRDTRSPQPQVRFDFATIERKMPGKTMETHLDEGWKWEELDRIDEAAGGATVAQRDGLKLLAAVIQHTDSKPQQQRLICLPHEAAANPEVVCAAPFMLINDLGLTFGKANLLNANSASSVNFENWSNKHVWQDPAKCIGKLSGSFTGTMTDPHISEAGRKFLADLLAKLSDAQLRDLFEVARFPVRSHVSVDDWVAAFKKKRDEVSGVTCPS